MRPSKRCTQTSPRTLVATNSAPIISCNQSRDGQQQYRSAISKAQCQTLPNPHHRETASCGQRSVAKAASIPAGHHVEARYASAQRWTAAAINLAPQQQKPLSQKPQRQVVARRDMKPAAATVNVDTAAVLRRFQGTFTA